MKNFSLSLVLLISAQAFGAEPCTVHISTQGIGRLAEIKFMLTLEKHGFHWIKTKDTDYQASLITRLDPKTGRSSVIKVSHLDEHGKKISVFKTTGWDEGDFYTPNPSTQQAIHQLSVSTLHCNVASHSDVQN